MKIYNTADVGSQFMSFLIYGLAGAGKTPMAATLAKWSPIIVSTEPGLLSLRRYKLPYVCATSEKDAHDILQWILKSNEANSFGAVFFDSASALSEKIISEKKKKSNDPRRFSPETTSAVMDIIVDYLLQIKNKHVIFTSKATESLLQNGAKYAEPFAVVPKLGPMFPYHFDNVLFIERRRDQNNQEFAQFLCRANDYCLARNRGDCLELYEPPDLGYIIDKILAKG